MVGAWKFRKAVRKMGLPCCSFQTGQQQDDSPPPIINNNNISNSAAASTKQEMISGDTESSTTNSVVKSLCAICLEPLSYSTGTSPGQAIFTAQCSHAFHFTCIASNVRHGSVTCPICRAHWTQLPRNLNYPQNPIPCNQQADPILRILDDSIATFRVHRRSSLRSARYDDDDPVEQDDDSSNLPRLHMTLLPVPLGQANYPPYTGGHPSLQVIETPPPTSYQCGFSPLHHQLGSSSQNTSPISRYNINPYLCSNNRGAAYLSVKLAHQQATDIVLVASPNGPHLRLLKQSMSLVVFSLRSVDRLAIVTYSSAATRAFPLRRMTSHGKRTALQVIDRLFYMGEADPGAGLKKGIKILEDRTHRNPESCILHLSDCPTRSYMGLDIEAPIPIHRFHVGFGFGTSNGFVMHEFEEFLARLLGGVIRDTQLRIGEDGGIVTLGELRGGEERRIPLNLGENGYVCVSYSYMENGGAEEWQTGEVVVSLEDKQETSDVGEGGGRDSNVGSRTSSAESWDYHDPYMARRWAKHLHGYRL